MKRWLTVASNSSYVVCGFSSGSTRRAFRRRFSVHSPPLPPALRLKVATVWKRPTGAMSGTQRRVGAGSAPLHLLPSRLTPRRPARCKSLQARLMLQAGDGGVLIAPVHARRSTTPSGPFPVPSTSRAVICTSAVFSARHADATVSVACLLWVSISKSLFSTITASTPQGLPPGSSSAQPVDAVVPALGQQRHAAPASKVLGSVGWLVCRRRRRRLQQRWINRTAATDPAPTRSFRPF